MHGENEVSNAPRVTCTIVHGAFVAVVAWLYFGLGYQAVMGIFGRAVAAAGNQGRLWVMFEVALQRRFRCLGETNQGVCAVSLLMWNKSHLRKNGTSVKY